MKISDYPIQGIDLNEIELQSHVLKPISEDDENIFISQSSKTALKEYSAKQNEQCAKELWRNLLIDAICILKMNDSREKMHNDTIDLLSKEKLEEFSVSFEKVRKLSTYGIDELVEYFNDFVEFESVLYGTGEYYRDHIHHVIKVWAIGIGLLFGSKPVNLKLSELYSVSESLFHNGEKVKQELSISKSEVWSMWTIIALCHDLGYPLEKATQINGKVKKIVNHFGCLNFNELNFNFDLLNSFLIDKFLAIVSSRTDHNKECIQKCHECEKRDKQEEHGHKTWLQQKYYYKIADSFSEFGHGVFSGFLIFKKLTYFLETDFAPDEVDLSCEDLRQFYIRKEILRAISGHTCPKIYHLDINTFAFMLIVCDEIQEWGRPRLEDLLRGTKGDVVSPFIKKFECIEKDGKNVTEIEIVMTYKDTIRLSEDKDDKEDGIKINDEVIQKNMILPKYRQLLYLLRSAKDDIKRSVIVKWHIVFANVEYQFDFDTNRNSFDSVRIEKLIKLKGRKAKSSILELY